MLITLNDQGYGTIPVSYTHLDVYKRQAVLLHKHVYVNKVQDFITNNNIDILTDDPTKSYVKDLNLSLIHI